MELEVSTSPRATWVWAADIDQAVELRKLLTAADCAVSSATGRNSEPRVLDLDIGVEALTGLEFLSDSGYTFRWHPGQYALNRSPSLFGLEVAEAHDSDETADFD
jgi:hypothetical protein